MTPLSVYFDTLENGGTHAEAVDAMMAFIENQKENKENE